MLPKESIVCGLGYDTPSETVTAYREALGLRPFMDNSFLSEVQEVMRQREDIRGGCGEGGFEE